MFNKVKSRLIILGCSLSFLSLSISCFPEINLPVKVPSPSFKPEELNKAIIDVKEVVQLQQEVTNTYATLEGDISLVKSKATAFIESDDSHRQDNFETMQAAVDNAFSTLDKMDGLLAKAQAANRLLETKVDMNKFTIAQTTSLSEKELLALKDPTPEQLSQAIRIALEKIKSTQADCKNQDCQSELKGHLDVLEKGSEKQKVATLKKLYNNQKTLNRLTSSQLDEKKDDEAQRQIILPLEIQLHIHPENLFDNPLNLTKSLNVSVDISGGSELSDNQFEWSIKDTSIATVTGKGRNATITAVGIGDTVLTLKVGKVVQTTRIIVSGEENT